MASRSFPRVIERAMLEPSGEAEAAMVPYRMGTATRDMTAYQAETRNTKTLRFNTLSCSTLRPVSDLAP